MKLSWSLVCGKRTHLESSPQQISQSTDAVKSSKWSIEHSILEWLMSWTVLPHNDVVDCLWMFQGFQQTPENAMRRTANIEQEEQSPQKSRNSQPSPFPSSNQLERNAEKKTENAFFLRKAEKGFKPFVSRLYLVFNHRILKSPSLSCSNILSKMSNHARVEEEGRGKRRTEKTVYLIFKS